ncbi:hypothetical protein HDU98_008348 [Podochytrium sp. JEL0797]|nr:hypothetical protein HDU98_008348 [Podochytrium sp. JEL0797]
MEFSPPDRIFSTIGVIMTALSLTLNGAIVLTNVSKVHKLAPPAFFAFLICCGDTIVATPILVLCSRNLFFDQILDIGITCQIHAVLLILGSGLALLLCLGLTILRYAMVVLNKDLHSLQFAVIYSAGCFIFLILTLSFPFLLHRADLFVLRPCHTYCNFNFTDRSTVGYIFISITVLAILVPTSFISFAYFRIYQRATNHLSEQASAVSRQSIAIVATFMIGWTPYLLVIFYEMISGEFVSPVIDFLASFCVTAYEVANPIVVVIFFKEIRLNLCGNKISEYFEDDKRELAVD